MTEACAWCGGHGTLRELRDHDIEPRVSWCEFCDAGKNCARLQQTLDRIAAQLDRDPAEAVAAIRVILTEAK